MNDYLLQNPAYRSTSLLQFFLSLVLDLKNIQLCGLPALFHIFKIYGETM
ncbi:hypothetical protein BAZSYMB_SCAFFOLD00004_47 [Bathymodiolus azoricus thioautotrophic gill symbiont]|uniref:Uncharacterized protein n=1 Tax=Bathymodiolus azoricus thioautotrophic gill symbiont TaxID=235205 RepID=A0A1H6J6Z3_9GAMM|nr:hypothetical protein BAZSYMB_SCAFFOLD00004_47 [Bathymodiolus azoricus thioautotrophic gill symbiont]SEH97659.1 hypothetical protein BAZSYMA_ACONTIG15717_3 [Bathymodiolus azoricus thioautotrophic gill symbiont]